MTLSTKTNRRDTSRETVPLVELSDYSCSLRDYLGHHSDKVAEIDSNSSNSRIVQVSGDLCNLK